MANTKSAIKAARKSERLTVRNKAVKTRLKTLNKKFQASVTSGDKESIRVAGASFASAMDRATKSGVVHKNAAARAKSKIARSLAAK